MNDMKAGVARYYTEYPDRLSDTRSVDAVAWSMRGMRRVLQILEQYDIQDRPQGVGKPAPAAAKE